MNHNVKRLCRYICPAVGGLCVTYFYNIVDGIFVGQGVGSAALGAVNIAVPFITFAVAIASMFPMGGATIIAIRMGRKDIAGANHAFMTSFICSVALSVMLTAVGMLFPKEIALLCGSGKLSNAMLSMSAEYIFYYTAFSIPMLMSNCLSVFVRNDGSPGLAFWGMCSGAAANIFLDWLFIFPMQMGITGAAIASGLGQMVSFAVLISHFVFKKGNLKFSRFTISLTLAGKICRRGVPEAASQLNTPVTALCYNLVLAGLTGDIGISTFSVLSFIFSLANAILSGVAQGLQPLWGQGYGKKDNDEIRYYLRWGIMINFVLSLIIYISLIAYDKEIIQIFNRDPHLVDMAGSALPVFALSFVPMGFNLILTALFFSTKQTAQANIIAVSRGIVMKALCIFFIPVIFGAEAVWYAAVASEIITLGIAFFLLRTNKLKR